MYKRIKNCLIEPKEIAKYANDKFWKLILYILILSFLLMIPTIAELRHIPSDVKSAITDNVKIYDKVEYVIKDNRLQSLTGINYDYAYEVYFENNVTGFKFYVNIGDELDYYSIKNPSNSIILHYNTDGVYFVMPLSDTKDDIAVNYKLCDYEGYNIDLRNIKRSESYERNQFFNIIKHYIDQKMPLIYAVCIPFIFDSSVVEIIIISFMMSLISFLVNKKFNLRFKIAFKLVVYSMLPYVLGYFFSQLFNGSLISVLFYYVGLFLTITYITIAIKQYFINLYANTRRKDENNESI